MLTHLKINNLAILENIEVSFHEGFTVLTGETGAGKSLVLDALNLLLGERASADVIRAGEAVSKIQAVFEPIPQEIKDLLDADILSEDTLLIERLIYKDKGNVVKVNGQLTSLTTLKQMAPYLADLHGQADTKTLLRPQFYPFLIDALSPELKALKTAYTVAFEAYQMAKDALLTFARDKESLEKEEAFMQFQYDELLELSPRLEDEEALIKTVSELENYDHIYHHLKSIEEGFSRGILSDIAVLSRSFQKLASLKSMDDLDQRFDSALIELEDIESSIANMVSQLDFNPATLEASHAKLAQYERLKRKHKTDTEGLIAYTQELAKKLSALADSSLHEATLKKTLETAETNVLKAAHTLTEARQQMALSKVADVTELLKMVSLDHAEFQIDFGDVSLESLQVNTPSSIDFLLAPNPGEPLKSIHKVASGGELSRVMLAIKVAFLKKDQVSTLIFDEIDTGVSGKVAANVGRLLQTIAAEIQVIAITHLPQVAAKANRHIYIAKSVENQRTHAHLHPLSEAERIETLAEMLSDGTLTDDQRQSAKALLQ